MMMDLLNDFIMKHFAASMVVMVIAVVCFGFIVWWCSALYYRIKKVEQLPCNAHGGRMGELEKTMAEIKEDLTVIKSVIIQHTIHHPMRDPDPTELAVMDPGSRPG